jgi:hypothetical protein
MSGRLVAATIITLVSVQSRPLNQDLIEVLLALRRGAAENPAALAPDRVDLVTKMMQGLWRMA